MNKRLSELDLLRALAVLLVLGRHLHPVPVDLFPPVRSFLVGWQKCGWIGVDLFFVLSGFLVSGLIFREYQRFGQVRIGRFLVRRGLKIYPAFYVFLFATVIIEFWLGRLTWKLPVFYEAAFIQNYGPALWNHTWSLAVEEHFYIALSFLVVCLAWLRRSGGVPFSPLPWIFIALAITLLALRIAMSLYVPYGNKSHMYPTHLRIDSLMFGVVLAYFVHFHQEAAARLVLRSAVFILPVAFGCILTSIYFNLSDGFMHSFGFGFLYLGFGAVLLNLIVWDSTAKRRLMRWGSAISMMGVYSYSIYLWHMPVQRWGIEGLRYLNGGELGYYVESFIYFGGSIVVGVAMAKIVEMPVLRLRDRWYPSRSGAVAHATS